ncbi:protein WALLS ARE THIN 1-like [Impatiens glandulifera]|uniref:protein WALLS ARE THIN 1-like n=1 Tax=Impatiens glandulifera TaxID=253017 RepID=UPI001FB132E7|nr:protein WALLS ARE THIN 1-like [Impatiens glandulifera]
MEGCWAMLSKYQLHLAMLALQFGYAGFHVVSRLALNMGISKIVFPVYRNILALLLLLPFAYFLEKKERPPINLSFLLQFFLLAVVGITANQGFYLLGLDHTSPTFASAIQNSVPAITFLMAVVLRIEKVRLDRRDGISKVLGTIFCVAGASVITLYKGPTIYSPSPLPRVQNVLPAAALTLAAGEVDGKSWTLGCVYLIGHCLSWSGWLVFQTPILKKYPAKLSFTSYQLFFGIIQFLIIALFCERDPQAWLIHSGSELFSVFYAGVVASGIAFAVQIWCIARGGPVFVAVYQPVQTLLVALMASIALGEQFYLGGIIGAVLIIAGLYLVLWGKSEEKKLATITDKGGIQSNADHTNTTTISHIRPSITQPLLNHETA